ncbi:MAG TPA: 23S rRNA (guanosine(2251)-2'-O)-methyltransferase RlmB [Acidimicrobiales bacterium]
MARTPRPRSQPRRPPSPGGGGGGGGPRRRGAPPARRSAAARGLGGDQVEGRQAVRELLLAGRRKVRELWIASEDGDRGPADLLALAAELRVPVQQVSRKRLDAEARSEAPQGVLAKAAPLQETDLDDLARGSANRPPFLVLVDGVTDPGNLGAILRSVDGAGGTGIVLPRHRAVHITPTAAKAAAGAIEHVPIAVVSGLPTAIERLRRAGVWVVGLDDRATQSLFELGDTATEPIALVLGAEGSGLSRLVRERCDVLVSIPMQGQLSSLNVSAAAALACYEVTRRRVV